MLLQVTLDDAAQADEMFSMLMGEDVEQRRSFIQRNATRRPLPRHLSRRRRALDRRRAPAVTDEGTDVTDDRPTPDGPGGRIEPVDLQVEMQRSYLDYAMSVIVGRALPDVRDGLKPVHRRVLYAMYDGGYRPDRGFSKCARVVGDVMGQYHPHGDTRDLRHPGPPGPAVVAALPAGPRPGQLRLAGQRPGGRDALHRVPDGAAGHGDGARHRRGHRRLPAQLRRPHRRSRLILPSRFPNLLVNGVGRHRGRHGHQHPAAQPARGRRRACSGRSSTPRPRREELLDALLERIKGPDFPTGALIVGRRGIEDAYRTGRGSVTMRAVVEVEEDTSGRTCLVVTELPYQVNPDNLALKIAELVDDGKVSGIADVRDDSSARTGQRLVIVLKRDAVAKVVLNNLYKHTQLQDNFGANMLALVDGVPRTLPLDAVHLALGRPPDRGHPAPHPLPAAQGRGARAHPARAASRRSTRSTRSSR